MTISLRKRNLNAPGWNAFCAALDGEGLTGKIGWKISCRVDDIEPGIMARCRDRGLLAVYLGVESGNGAGLATLNKHATVEQNLEAMRTLRSIGVEFDMGFMLLDPGTTFASIRENVAFLRKVAELGGPPITFVKMLPLAGTAVEKRLEEEGRLTGDRVRPDYNFLDRRLDYYALWITLRFTNRNSAQNGLVETLRMAYFDHLVEQAFEGAPEASQYGREIRSLIDLANDSGLETLERSLDVAERCPRRGEPGAELARAEPDCCARRGGAIRDFRTAGSSGGEVQPGVMFIPA